MPPPPCATTAIRGALVAFRGEPSVDDDALVYEPDALVLMRDGHITACGATDALLPALPTGTPVTHYPGALVSAGFVDAHVHYPQLAVIGAGGLGLLDWLDRYTCPAEPRLAEAARPPCRQRRARARGRPRGARPGGDAAPCTAPA
jgi:guanine deaminase